MALAEEMDYVLIDTTPVLPVTDSVVVSRFSDATIVVVGAGLTRRHDLQRALAALEQAGAPVIGAVFNRAVGGDRYVYGYGYGYAGYRSTYGSSRSSKHQDADSLPVGTGTS
jgi:Mrp family chromosome partitioning ATPase